MKEGLTNPRKRATRTRQLIQSVWADLRNGFKEDITEIYVEIVVVWIRR